METNTHSAKPAEPQVVSLDDILGGGEPVQIPSFNDPNPSPTLVTPVTPPVTTTVVEPVVPVTTPSTEVTDPATYADFVQLFNKDTAPQVVKDTYAELISTFKATSVDDKGNLLDQDNKILITADKVEEYLMNDTLPLNEEGSLIDANGNVLVSAEELRAQSSLVGAVRNALETNLDIAFDDETDFPDTMEGIVELVSKGIKQKETTIVKNFLESNPELKHFANHIALGNSVESYKASTIDYKSIDVKTLDTQTKLNLLTQVYKEQGNTDPGYLIDILKNAGDEALNRAAYDSIKYLDNKQTAENEQRDQQVRDLQITQERETQQYWKQVESTINLGKLNNINIPVKERQAFFDFMSKPVDEDYNSAESLKAQQESLEFQLLVSYLRFKDGDLSQLASNLAKHDRVQTLTERMNKNRRINRDGVPRTTSSTGKGGNAPLSLDDLLG